MKIPVCYEEAMVAGTGVKGCVQSYSKLRCEITGKVEGEPNRGALEQGKAEKESNTDHCSE